jgi:hypothetical protein
MAASVRESRRGQKPSDSVLALKLVTQGRRMKYTSCAILVQDQLQIVTLCSRRSAGQCITEHASITLNEACM